MSEEVGLNKDKSEMTILEKRNKLEEKLIIISNNRALEKYDFKTAKIERVIFNIEEYGINDNYFGGNCARLAKLKDSKFMLIVSKQNTTLGILVPKECLPSLTKHELEWIASFYKIKIDSKMTKEDIVERIKKV